MQRARNQSGEPEDDEEIPFIQLLDRLIFRQGWNRHLLAEQISESGLCRVRTRSEGSDFSETDIVGLYSAEEFEKGDLDLKMVKFDCRQFLLERGLLR